jgi:L-asparaginase II
MTDPVTIEVLRGGLVESRHQFHAVIADANGQVPDAWGDRDRLVFPRSSVKPIHALPLIETGEDKTIMSSCPIAILM